MQTTYKFKHSLFILALSFLLGTIYIHAQTLQNDTVSRNLSDDNSKNYATKADENQFRLNSVAADQPILFFTIRDGNQEIYKMNADGTNQQNLTNSPENEVYGKWSPDGNKIIYSKSSQLWVMNADGGNQTMVSGAAGLFDGYSWSPNGNKILFTKGTTFAEMRIWTANSDGSNPVQITNTTLRDYAARWSPDGGKIAFTRCSGVSINTCDIFVMNPDGSNQTNLTSANTGYDENPRWTPDGKILYSTFMPTYYNLYLMNADGTNKQPLTNFVSPRTFNPGIVSPDGNKVAIASESSPSSATDIFTIEINGSNFTNLTNNSSIFDRFGAWSPDSSKIAFFSNRDGNDEIYVMNADGSGVVRLTNNSVSDVVTDWKRTTAEPRAAFDFDGDGKADISVFRPDGGNWYLLNSSSGFTAAQFGDTNDKIVPADYDGDGKTDIAVYRAGVWHLNRSTAGFTGFAFGAPDDIPQPADFDGDGKAELVVWRPSNGTWYVYNLANNQFTSAQFGAEADKPVVGDYDGDNKADYAVFRPSNGTWYLNRSTAGFTGIQFGDAADKPVPADYDGDGKTDVSVFRPSNGTWYLNRSQLGFTGIQFGISTDLPTPADYDGDGKADIAVFRSGVWYLQRSTAGFTGIQFGAASDKPIPNAFIP